jgi:hypothetical protein
MKKIFMLISALVIPFLGMSQKDGLEENFNDNVLKDWQGSARYTLAVENGELKVETDVLASRYDGFKFFFPDTLDLTLVPYVKIKIKSASLALLEWTCRILVVKQPTKLM